MGQTLVDSIWLLVTAGMREKDVLNLPLDKFWLYVEAENRRGKLQRKIMVADTANSIAGVFGKDGIDKYLKGIDGDK